MTVADQIKAETHPLSIARGVMAAENCVRWKMTEFESVWVCEYTFIDGSRIVHRGYL